MIKYLTKYKRRFFIAGVFASLAVLSLNSCTTVDNTLGDDLIDPSLKDLVKIDSNFNVSASTVSDYRLIGSFTDKGWIGSYNDPVFGNIEAAVGMQFYPSSMSFYKKNAATASTTLDSLVIILKLNNGVGDSLAYHTMDVYQMTALIKSDSTYYANSTLIDSIVPTPITKNPVTYNRKENRTIRVKLSNAYAKMLVNDIDTTKITDVTTFMAKFKGLLLKNKALTSKGSLNSFLFKDSSNMYLYYRIPKAANESGVADSTVSIPFHIGTYSQKINFTSHKYNSPGAVVKPINPAEGATGEKLTYIQGLGGMRTKIKFDQASIDRWLSLNKDANIYRAELVVEIPDGDIDFYRLPSALTPYYEVSDTCRFINDMYTFVGQSKNAFYNRSKRYYSINITSFFKDAMRGTKPRQLYLFPGYPSGLSSSSTNIPNTRLTGEYYTFPSQAILGNAKSAKPFRLIITYSN